MRSGAAGLLLAVLTLPAAAQTGSEKFSAATLVAGASMTERECAAVQPAAWVVVDGKGDCIRYWISTRGGATGDAQVFLHGDMLMMTSRNEPRAIAEYSSLAPETIQRVTDSWSRRRGGTYVYVARPGVFGSSGDHNQRRRIREVLLIDAALSAIKQRHGFSQLHVVGQSGGGHLVASVLPRRTDIACAVISSGVTSVWTRLRDLNRVVDVTGYADPYDPIEDVGRIDKRTGLRIFVVTDPEDKLVSMRSQNEYVERAKAAGLPIAQVYVEAPDPRHHSLAGVGQQLAIDCAQGLPTDVIVKKYTNKPPS